MKAFLRDLASVNVDMVSDENGFMQGIVSDPAQRTQ